MPSLTVTRVLWRMRRGWFFIFPFFGSSPLASRHGQWPDPWVGVTEYCSLLAEIEKSRAAARRLLKEAGAEGLSFELLNRNADPPFKYAATWLIGDYNPWQVDAAVARVPLLRLKIVRRRDD